MTNQVKLLEDLYYGDRETVIAAINDKRYWIENTFYVPGNIDETYDEHGLVHFPLIEALYNNVLLFSEIDFSSKDFNKSECELIQDSSKHIAVLDLYKKIDLSKNVPFWVEYNFTKIELSAYHEFVANLYNKLPYAVLNIDKSKIGEAGCDLIKCLIIGGDNESILILSKDKLLNMCYDCRIAQTIYYQKDIDSKLLESLKEISLKNEIELKEINEYQSIK